MSQSVKMKVLDLFSGIGGFSLGLEMAGGFETVAFCEIDPDRRAVLSRHWPGVPIHDDITTLTAADLPAGIDVITGGFPCQDISRAGIKMNLRGIHGERSSLWFEYARLIGELRPRYAIVENSPDLIIRGFGDFLRPLAEFRYAAEWRVISASAIGAPHLRQRLLLVAYPDQINGKERMAVFDGYQGKILSARKKNRDSVWSPAARRSIRDGYGFSDRLDQRVRTEMIGDSVCPQVVEVIGTLIELHCRDDEQ